MSLMQSLEETIGKGGTVHIYAVSRLYNKSPTAWEATLRKLEGAREIMLAQYAPLRHAIRSELLRPGTGDGVLQKQLAKMKDAPSQRAVCDKSRHAFRVFCSTVRPLIVNLVEDYLRTEYHPPSVLYEGIQLEGRFHLKVEDTRGATKLIYLHASEWDDDETRAFIELLTILAEEQHCGSRGMVWFIDLVDGAVQPVPRTYKRVRKELVRTSQLLSRFESLMRFGNGA